MIIVATAKIYDLQAKGYVKENKFEQFVVNDKSEATEFDIFKANRYVNMMNNGKTGENRDYTLAAIKITKYEVKQWLKSMAK